VNEGDPILEVETDKAAVEIPSPYTGTIEEIRVKAGETVHVGDVMMTFSDDGAAKADKQSKARGEDYKKPEIVEGKKEEAPPKVEPKGERPVPASPSTRRLARELGVELREVPATGPEGLVTAEDVRGFAGKGREKEAERKPVEEKAPAGKPAVPAEIPALPDFTRWGPVEREPLRGVRKATAKQMALAWSQIPHVSSQEWIDITLLEEFRRKQKGMVASEGGKLSLTVFALKAATAALKKFPRFNSSLDLEAGEIILKNYYNIGVAVDTEDGLIVPVIRDVDRKSVIDLSIELSDLVSRTRERKIKIEEMQGGTFTITNVGPMGGGFFSPIINHPQVAIMGMGSARLKQVVRRSESGETEAVIRLMMPLVLCIDHRVLDGADAFKFMKLVGEALGSPDELLLRMT
jgi:pyruvate dehydrogenase E2 component (dihydrolipoamide acetyltransferase)